MTANTDKKPELKIAAVTVTFNRTVTLQKCVAALLDQTRPVDALFIVDNHSRPEEQEIIRAIAASDPRITVIWLNDNLGGAGGFEAGMKAARESETVYDYVWIMDDDAYPRPDCLEKLLKAASVINAKTEEKRIGFLAPLIYGVDLQEHQLYHHKRLTGPALQDKQIATSVDELHQANAVEANAFVGVLISKKAMDTVGIADGGMFIYGDDTEYTYRVTRCLKGYLIRDAVIDHQDPPMTTNFLQPEAWWKEYYKNRNRYFIVREFITGPGRVLGYISLMLPMIAQMPSALLKPKYKGFHLLRVKMLYKSIRDGLTNNRGKTVDPGEYVATILKRKKRIETRL